MLIEIGIFLSVYTSTRLFKRNPKKTTQLSLLQKSKQQQQKIAEHKHHFKISSITLLSTSIGRIIYPPISLVNLALLTYSATPMFSQAERSLVDHKKIQNDTYSALLASFCLLSNQYFAAAVHNIIYHFGCQMVDENKQLTHAQMSEVFLQHSEQAWVIRQGVEIELPINDIKKGEIIIIRNGEISPVDGKIIKGQALIDTQMINGEIQPTAKQQDDTINAHSLVLSGQIYIRTTCDGVTSKCKQLNELLNNTQEYKTRLQLEGESWANNASLPLITLATVIWPFAGLASATALLFSAPNNTLRSLLSLQTHTHLRWAAEQGILIKDGRVLEELPWIDTILFDKTGTLTEAIPKVNNIISLHHAYSENTLLVLAASTEQHLSHPIAKALINESKHRGLKLPIAEKGHYDLGTGVKANINGKLIQVGNFRYIKQCTNIEQCSLKLKQIINNNKLKNITYLFIAIDGNLQGIVTLIPQLRQDAKLVIEKLRKRGFQHISLVSGDSQSSCEDLAEELALDAIYAEMMPQDKADLIRNLQNQGRKVCFIGDGLNDTVAMKQANVSICLANADNLTHHIAQIVLLKDNLLHLQDTFDLATHLQIRLAGNLGFWVSFGVFNAICVPLLHFSPLQSSILYAGAFSYKLKHSRSTDWLDRKDRHMSERDNLIIDITPQ